MLSICINTVIGIFRIPPGVIGSTIDSDSISASSSPARVTLMPSSFKKRDMKRETDNSEPDPYKSQDFSAGFTQRKIAHDLKSCVYGYCEVSSGRPKAFC